MKKIALVVWFVLPLCASVKAQVDTVELRRHSIWLHGLNYLWGSFRSEFDYAFKDGKNGISIMPVIYFNNTGDGINDGSSDPNQFKMDGLGLEFAYRHFLKLDDAQKRIGYIKTGIGYSQLKYEFRERAWFDYIGSDGLTYSEFRVGDQSQKTDRIDAFVLFGIKRNLNVGFYLDYYAGFVYKKSYINTSSANIVDAFDLFSGQSVTGVMPRLGISLGVYL